jgi:hypothetical protein
VIAVDEQMDWDEDGMTIDGTRFRVGFGADVIAGPNDLLLMKPPWMVERYVELVDALRPLRVVELGIFCGGSVALLTLLAKPELYRDRSCMGQAHSSTPGPRASFWRALVCGDPLWWPSLDNVSLPHVPAHAIATGEAEGIPILVGTTTDEFIRATLRHGRRTPPNS